MTLDNKERAHPYTLPMVMLDIETLGLRQNSVVWEIGAILFTGWPDFEVLAEEAWYLNMQDQEQRFLDPLTMAWTAQVGGDFRRMPAFIEAAQKGLPVCEWLGQYKQWLAENWPWTEEERFKLEGADFEKIDPCTWVWGPHFDIALLENMIESMGLGPAPWKYDKPMDVRTLDRLFTLFGGDDDKDKSEVPHDALGDCRLQFRRFKKAFKLLGKSSTSLKHL